MNPTVAEAVADTPLAELTRKIDQISTLPQIALSVMKVAGDPNAGAADLKAVMESDVALSARVLRCVNSSAYAMRTKITNLQQAIAYLGMKQIRNLAMTASVSHLFRQDECIGTYKRGMLWRHLVSVGLCGRLIAMRLKFANFEDMFLAGLLHDVGIVLEDQYAHPAFVAAIQALPAAKNLPDVERQYLGFDHTMLGECVAECWSFPEPMRAVIRHHHSVPIYQGEHMALLQCVEVANLMCSLKGVASVGVAMIRVAQPTLNGLGLTRQDLVVLSEDLDQEIAQNNTLFQM